MRPIQDDIDNQRSGKRDPHVDDSLLAVQRAELTLLRAEYRLLKARYQQLQRVLSDVRQAMNRIH